MEVPLRFGAGGDQQNLALAEKQRTCWTQHPTVMCQSMLPSNEYSNERTGEWGRPKAADWTRLLCWMVGVVNGSDPASASSLKRVRPSV